jgi:phosphoribosyl 1,2-cyclic phosphate phosphodiesterase
VDFGRAALSAAPKRLKPQHAILTNLHTDLDYEKLRRELPPQVEPAFDGMSIEVQDH